MSSQYLPQRLSSLSSFRWHRIAYSVQAKSVTLYLDCQRVETLDLLRADSAEVSTGGVTLFGSRLMDEAAFMVGHYRGVRVSVSVSASVCLWSPA